MTHLVVDITSILLAHFENFPTLQNFNISVHGLVCNKKLFQMYIPAFKVFIGSSGLAYICMVNKWYCNKITFIMPLTKVIVFYRLLVAQSEICISKLPAFVWVRYLSEHVRHLCFAAILGQISAMTSECRLHLEYQILTNSHVYLLCNINAIWGVWCNSNVAAIHFLVNGIFA